MHRLLAEIFRKFQYDFSKQRDMDRTHAACSFAFAMLMRDTSCRRVGWLRSLPLGTSAFAMFKMGAFIQTSGMVVKPTTRNYCLC